MHDLLGAPFVPAALFTLTSCLVLGGILFAIGAWGVLARRNILIVLISIELMLNAVNLVFASFARAHTGLAAESILSIDNKVNAMNNPETTVKEYKEFQKLSWSERRAILEPLERQKVELSTSGQTGQIFALFIIAVAAAEAAVGLAIVITFFRNKESVDTREMSVLKQ